jgi:hypothetical protein
MTMKIAHHRGVTASADKHADRFPQPNHSRQHPEPPRFPQNALGLHRRIVEFLPIHHPQDQRCLKHSALPYGIADENVIFNQSNAALPRNIRGWLWQSVGDFDACLDQIRSPSRKPMHQLIDNRSCHCTLAACASFFSIATSHATCFSDGRLQRAVLCTKARCFSLSRPKSCSRHHVAIAQSGPESCFLFFSRTTEIQFIEQNLEPRSSSDSRFQTATIEDQPSLSVAWSRWRADLASLR